MFSLLMVQFTTCLIILDMKLSNGELEKSSSMEGVDATSGSTAKLRPFGESFFVCNLLCVEARCLIMDSSMEEVIHRIWGVSWASQMFWEGTRSDPLMTLPRELRMEMHITVL